MSFPVILASRSPERKRILSVFFKDFQVMPAEADESGLEAESVRERVERLAELKAATIARGHPDALVIAADTLLEVDGRALGKAKDRNEAKTMLKTCSGRQVRVLTAQVARRKTFHLSRTVESLVAIKAFDDAELERYLDSGEWTDRAGCFTLDTPDSSAKLAQGEASSVRGLSDAFLHEVLAKVQP